MPTPIEFYFDFGSPNSYLSYKVLPGIAQRIGATVELKPALLGGIFKATNNQSPAVTLANIPTKAAYERRETERFVARHALTKFRSNPAFPINTLVMMRGSVLAQKLGLFEAYVDAIYSGMWEQALDMGQPEVFQGVLQTAGLPVQEFLEHVADPDVKAGLIASTEEAIARGVFGSPTFFVGQEMFFGKDRLRDVKEEYLRVAGQSATSPVAS